MSTHLNNSYIQYEAQLFRKHSALETSAARLLGEALQTIRIFAEALEKAWEIYEFRQSLKSYDKIVDGQSLVVLETNSEPFKNLRSAWVLEKKK